LNAGQIKKCSFQAAPICHRVNPLFAMTAVELAHKLRLGAEIMTPVAGRLDQVPIPVSVLELLS
jgi:hypothetical protein